MLWLLARFLTQIDVVEFTLRSVFRTVCSAVLQACLAHPPTVLYRRVQRKAPCRAGVQPRVMG
jgi:hypothetical protein